MDHLCYFCLVFIMLACTAKKKEGSKALKMTSFFSTFRKITVGGFVNQLIKNFWPNLIHVP